MPRTLSRVLSLNNRQRRTFISSLFGLTALASVLTVSAQTLLPCPVPHGRHADADGSTAEGSESTRAMMQGRRAVGPPVVEKKPRRWIEETRSPAKSTPPQSNVHS